MTLDELAIKHGTDKSSKCHNYTAIYEQMFEPIRNESLKILEIGVLDGASLRMWLEYFPNAEIHGVDINLDQMKGPVLNSERLIIHIGNQSDKDFLDSIGTDFDIVTDDGSHQVTDQIFSFKCLWPTTKMVYIVEDVYTSYLARYGGGYRRTGTAIEFFKNLVDDANARRLAKMYKAQGLHLSYKDIGMIQFYASLVCVYKGK